MNTAKKDRKALVIDCETKDIRDLDAFEISYAVVNLDTFEIESIKGYLIKEVYDTELYRKAYYYRANHKTYTKMLEEGKLELVGLSHVRNELNRIMKEEGITYISAFNMKFDLKALSFNFIKYLNSDKQITYNSLEKAGFKSLDIPTLFLNVKILKDFEYVDFCINNDFITDKGNIKTNAEVMYAFITKNVNHKEEHVALQDVKEEAEMLIHVFKEYGKEGIFNFGLLKSERDTKSNIQIWKKIKNSIATRT